MWRYAYQAVDQHGQVTEVLVPERRDIASARRSFTTALASNCFPISILVICGIDDLIREERLGWLIEHHKPWGRAIIGCEPVMESKVRHKVVPKLVLGASHSPRGTMPPGL